MAGELNQLCCLSNLCNFIHSEGFARLMGMYDSRRFDRDKLDRSD